MPALIALLLTAFVMRGPVTGVGPVAAEVVAAYGTTWSLYGLLAALPVAAFGLCSFLAPALQARLGLCGAASAALALLLLGTALRFIANLAAFAGGMFLLGAGIAAHAGRHQNALAEKNRHADGTLYRHDRAFRCGGRAHGCAAFCLGRELELALWFLDRGSPAGADGLAAPDAVQDARTVKRIAVLCTKASGG